LAPTPNPTETPPEEEEVGQILDAEADEVEEVEELETIGQKDEVETSEDGPDAPDEPSSVHQENIETQDGDSTDSMENKDAVMGGGDNPDTTNVSDELTEQQIFAEQEIARLNAEVERLRQSMAGAADVIEELETPPMPPAVIEDIVIGAHIVGDFARLARQLDREQLIRATMGTIAMLHPDNLGLMISTRNRVMLPRLDERGMCAGLLGQPAPRGAPTDWRTLEVILALVSSAVTGGPAAVIHSHGAYTTAASCEKDLVLVKPIDVIGKEQIGSVIIVDPDEEDPADFLKQITEALYQGGMRCVVVRGMGAYAVGATLEQAWANAAMLEHSMRIVLLARQANLKV
jgi:ribulose-5-phosphate 4-epimerase/fuculose-1-phosphate aldolase